MSNSRGTASCFTDSPTNLCVLGLMPPKRTGVCVCVHMCVWSCGSVYQSAADSREPEVSFEANHSAHSLAMASALRDLCFSNVQIHTRYTYNTHTHAQLSARELTSVE